MTCAPTLARSAGVQSVTVARVPTSMNTGVSTRPCAVSIDPRRAREPGSVTLTSNGNIVLLF
jgi:hypothetical protein